MKLNEKRLTNASNNQFGRTTMSKKNRNAVVATEVKNEVEVVNEVVAENVDPFAYVAPALKDGYQTGLAAKITEYVSREDSCAAAMTKEWMTNGLTYAESMAFCVKWMADHKPTCTWGSKRVHIQAHRNWLRKQYWMNTEVDPVGKIKVIGEYQF